MKKSVKEMNEENIENYSTNVCKMDIIQKYEQRPATLKEIYLADFVAWYDFTRSKQQNASP